MSDKYTADQLKLLEWMALPKYERIPPNLEMLAASIGVDERTLYRWKKLPGLQEDVNRLARAGIGNKLPEVYGALIRQAEAGEFQHIRLLLELAGEYTPVQRNENQNSGEMTVRIVEVDAAAEDD